MAANADSDTYTIPVSTLAQLAGMHQRVSQKSATKSLLKTYDAKRRRQEETKRRREEVKRRQERILAKIRKDESEKFDDYSDEEDDVHDEPLVLQPLAPDSPPSQESQKAAEIFQEHFSDVARAQPQDRRELQEIKETIVPAIMETVDTPMSRKEEQLVKRRVDTRLNTSLGVKLEKRARNYWANEHGKTIADVGKLFKKRIFDIGESTFILSGKVDGIVEEDEKRIFEIKNRTKELCNEVLEYEKVQVHAYLFLCDLENAYLVEALHKEGDEFETHTEEIQFDQAFWDSVVGKVKDALEKYFQEP